MRKEELDELVEVGLLSEEKVVDILHYWEQRPSLKSNRLSVVFSLLGALLGGLGVILVVAHNWDQLPRLGKVAIAFLPVLVAQCLGWYTLQKKADSRSWRESSGVLLLLAVGACLAMVSQVYHINGKMEDFLFVWICLALPIIYILDAAVASLLLWGGLTWYAAAYGYNHYSNGPAYWYVLFAIAVLPFYWHIRTTRSASNYLYFHDWVIPGSLAICLGTLVDEPSSYLWVSYQVFFVILFMIGKWVLISSKRLLVNGWLLIGMLGSVIMLLIQSFDAFWKDVKELFPIPEGQSDAIWLCSILLLIMLVLWGFLFKKGKLNISHPLPYLGILAVLYFNFGKVNELLGVIVANVLLLMLGIYYIKDGTRRHHLGILNFGLLVITALIGCRFFDTDLSFAVRGVLFLLVGGGFLAANMMMLRRRKS